MEAYLSVPEKHNTQGENSNLKSPTLENMECTKVAPQFDTRNKNGGEEMDVLLPAFTFCDLFSSAVKYLQFGSFKLYL
jgi:hypothetical protein